MSEGCVGPMSAERACGKRQIPVPATPEDSGPSLTGCTCDRDTLIDNMASPGCPVHSPHERRNSTCERCKPYPGDPCVCGWEHL